MSGLIHSVGGIVEAGMKSFMDLAEGYMLPMEEEKTTSDDDSNSEHSASHYSMKSHPLTIDRTCTIESTSSDVSSRSSAPSKVYPPRQEPLIQIIDVPSGWIHIQSTYIDDSISQRKVRSFGVKNLTERLVDLEVDSDLGGQLLFWQGDDERASSSASSTSSFSSTTGSRQLHLALLPRGTSTIFLAFTASTSQSTSPLVTASLAADEGAYTPRMLPSISRQGSSDPSTLSSSVGLSSDTPSEHSGHSGGSRLPPALKPKGETKRSEPVHRAVSVHGSISLRASGATSDATEASHDMLANHNQSAFTSLSLPFFATVCRSLFTAAVIDSASGLVSGAQQSSGQLVVDFGSDLVVGGEYHRDIMLVNRSEIELIWTTHIVNSRFKDSVWFSLRDIDSENVFGVDTTSQPVPLPVLSSRHLRLTLRILKAPIIDYDFDFVISNTNGSGNAVVCRASGSGQSQAIDESLRVLSGNSVDFGQIVDGVWAKKTIMCKNTGDRPLDVHLSATKGFDVVFRLAGVAGDDLDEGTPEKPRQIEKKGSGHLSRTSMHEDHRGRGLSASHRSSRGASPSSSLVRSLDTAEIASISSSFSANLAEQLDAAETNSSRLGFPHLTMSDKRSNGGREPSLTWSRPLSRVASHTSSSRYAGESDDDDGVEQPFLNGGEVSNSSPVHVRDERGPHLPEAVNDKTLSDQIEEITVRPGTEYRIFVLYRPARDTISPLLIAGALRTSSFKVYLDSTPIAQRAAIQMSRRTLNCTAESCTSLISITTGTRVDFGEVTVGASKSATISIENLSALSAKVEIAAISKVLSANRNVIVIPPFETVEEKLEFFPRRINDSYEKQIFVRNLLNRLNDQLVEIRSKNIDVYNLTLHSHLYRILTPFGSNFLDFASVVINSPTVRPVQFENLSQAVLSLELSASQAEDVELFVKAEDAATIAKPVSQGRYAEDAELPERIASPPNFDLKERFMETLRELGQQGPAKVNLVKTAAKRDKSTTRAVVEGEIAKQSVGVAVASALKKGGRGRPVQLYGNAFVFKDRTLLEDHEYLDLASGPPVAAHRTSPRSKKTQLLDSIELEDKSKLSGQHPRVPKLDFAASAKATGLLKKDIKPKKTKTSAPPPGSKPDIFHAPSLAAMISAITGNTSNTAGGAKSPALTGKKVEPKSEMFAASDVSKMTVDDLLVAVEQHDAKKALIAHSTLEEEEQFVRRTISLRKELNNLISTGKLVPVRTLSIPSASTKQLIVIMTPNGSIRPHVSNRAKRADSRIFIKLAEFDRSLLYPSGDTSLDLTELPVRDLIIRSSCVRSILEVQQSSINFGACDKGVIKSKSIVIHNKSDITGLFRLRTSGSIASGDLKLGLGRYGVISAFGRKEVGNFSFTPSLVGDYKETIVVENVLDTYNDQQVSVKAVVRKQPTFAVEPTNIDFGSLESLSGKWPSAMNFVLTNVSKHERTFVVEVTAPPSQSVAQVSLTRDDKDVGTALSKGEEEELEGLLQKLKIARRKGKTDKITKYETRLVELGQPIITADLDADSPASGEASAVATPLTEYPPNVVDEPKTCVSTLSVALQPDQKSKILVELVPYNSETSPFTANIRVYDRKNTDETVIIAVRASRSGIPVTSSQTISASSSSSDPLHVALMRHCLNLTLQCPVSQTAFCVGSTLFIPSHSTHFPSLSRYFTPFFLDPSSPPVGLILGDGYSRQIPGNTHAEANALTNFRSRYAELSTSTSASDLPPIETVLQEVECYATMEPCSIRTSGGPSCALELVRAKVSSVYLGVEEPPDFVQCEGVQILQGGRVEVKRVVGLEEECLRAARRGRS